MSKEQTERFILVQQLMGEEICVEGKFPVCTNLKIFFTSREYIFYVLSCILFHFNSVCLNVFVFVIMFYYFPLSFASICIQYYLGPAVEMESSDMEQC